VGEASREMAADTIMTRILKQQHICSVFHHNLYSYRGVFIAQRFTYPLATIPILPPNCPRYRIFHGLFGNIKHADSMDYRWPDMWVLVLFQILRRPTSSIRASGPGLRRASSPLLFRLISIHPCIFTSGPSLGYLRDFAGWDAVSSDGVRGSR